MFENITNEEEAIEYQEKLKDKVELNKKISETSIKKIAGVDLAYWSMEGVEYAVCCIVILDYKTLEVIEKVHHMGRIEFPYIPGCLSFREIPLFLEANAKIKNVPDLYMFDGNGYLHPRHLGMATHAGILLDLPSIGVAKSYYKVENVDFDMPENEAGSYKDITILGDIYGRVLRTHMNVKPVIISIGNQIDIDTTKEIVMNTVTKESHIPHPTRLADLETHIMRDYYKDEMLHE